MSGREIRLQEILKYIKLGIDDAALKEQYKLSEQGLKSLHEKLFESGFLRREGRRYFIPGKRRINTAEVVRDILSGATDLELMEKYRVSSRKLQRVFSKLVNMGAITREDLSHRNDPDQNLAKPELRGSTRTIPILSPSIYEKANPENRGMVRDLSDEGIGARGITAELDEVKTLVIAPELGMDVEAFSFQATCRWFRIEDDGDCHSGFEIAFISGPDFKELQKSIQLMTVLL
jgi:uncharacterized protein (DUF433 family)